MKKIFSLLLILFVSITLVSCDKPEDKPTTDPDDSGVVEIDFDAEIAKVNIPPRLTSSIVLPTELAGGAIEVTWESSNEDVIASDGSFFMPEIDTDLTLTATFNYNGSKKVKTYNVQAYTKEKGFAVAYKMYSGAVQSEYTYSTPFSVV